MPPARILVAEAEARAARDMAARLEGMGHQVTAQATTAEEALAAAREDQPDLALVDAALPGTGGGVELARRLKSDLDIGVVLMAGAQGLAGLGGEPESEDLGYLLRPVEDVDLARALDVALAASRAESRMASGQDRFHRMIEQLVDPIFGHDHEGRFVLVNQAACQSMGYTRQELLTLSVDNLDAGVLTPELKIELVSRISRGERVSLETVLRRKDGSTFPVELSLSQVELREGPIILGTARDITARQEAQAGLAASEKRFRELWESMTDLVYTQDLQGRFLSFNPSLERILGYQAEEIIGQKAADYMKPELREQFDSEYLAQLKTEGVHQGISPYLHKDGHKVYLEYKSQLVTPAGGEPYIAGMGRDVTERIMDRRRLDLMGRQLAQAQKMEALGTLAGGIAHDFNNILVAVMGYAELAAMKAADHEDNRPEMDSILTAARRARDLVRQILAFSRRSPAQLGPLDLNPVVRQAADLLAQALPRGVELELVLEEGLWPAMANSGQVQQALMNLASNAADAMPQGGTITVSTRSREMDAAEAGEAGKLKPGRYVELVVGDTGAGMDDEVRARIFDPFFTTKEVGRGTGLGLAIVYGVVEAHGGSVACASRPGQGSRFTILLPAAKERPPREDDAAAGEVPEPAWPGGVVMVVDDESVIRELAAQFLETAGMRCFTASDGESALELLEGRSGRVDLVVLDLGMPGMGGMACLKEMLRRWPEIKVLMATGYAQRNQEEACRQAGARGFLAKPFGGEELISAVRNIMGSPRPGPTA